MCSYWYLFRLGHGGHDHRIETPPVAEPATTKLGSSAAYRPRA
jgi:hypothetical protein